MKTSKAAAAALAAYPVGLYIRLQRGRLARRSQPLPTQTKERFGNYFRSLDLDRARVVEGDPLPIPTPPFRTTARRYGLDFPEVTLVEAITRNVKDFASLGVRIFNPGD